MCEGIALAGSEIPTELEGHRGLPRREYRREDRLEYRFLDADRRPCLPVLRGGQIFLARWGNTRKQSRFLPRSNWTWQEAIGKGEWRDSEAEEVVIPATFAVGRGRWFRVTRGIRGLLVPDERRRAVVYMICEPPSHYYNVMTRADRMPAFIDQCF